MRWWAVGKLPNRFTKVAKTTISYNPLEKMDLCPLGNGYVTSFPGSRVLACWRSPAKLDFLLNLRLPVTFVVAEFRPQDPRFTLFTARYY